MKYLEKRINIGFLKKYLIVRLEIGEIVRLKVGNKIRLGIDGLDNTCIVTVIWHNDTLMEIEHYDMTRRLLKIKDYKIKTLK